MEVRSPAANVAKTLALDSFPLAALPDVDATLESCLKMVASQTAFTISSCRYALAGLSSSC